MLCDKTRTRSGDMSLELQARIDRLLDEFMQSVDAIAQDRHLQKGIARSQLPSSMVAILDRDTLSILAQFRGNQCSYGKVALFEVPHNLVTSGLNAYQRDGTH